MLCKNSFGLYIGNGAVNKLQCACVCVCVSCELSLFHASHTGLRNNSLYYREEHTQCHLALVHIPAFRAPRKPNSHSQVIPFPFPPLWLDAVTNFASQKNVSGLPHTGIESVFFSPHYLRIMCFWHNFSCWNHMQLWFTQLLWKNN